MSMNKQNQFGMDLHHIANLIRSADIHLNENVFDGNSDALEAIFSNINVALEKADTMAGRFEELENEWKQQANSQAANADENKAVEAFITRLVKGCGVPVDGENEKRIIEKVVRDLTAIPA